MGILKHLFFPKNLEFPLVCIKTSKKWGIPIFCSRVFGSPHVFFTLGQKVINILGIPNEKNVGKMFVIPISSLGGGYLISGIAH